MKTYIFLISLFLIAALSFSNSYAQQQDSLKQKQINFLSKTLTTSRDTATLVINIMSAYKENVKKVIADPTLKEDARRAKIDELIADKNKKLALVLNPAQQAKIIPTTERKQNQTGK
jgi:hypothetical protein